MLSDLELRAFEKYILNGRKDVKEGLNMLPVQSDAHNFLRLMHSLSQDDNSIIDKEDKTKEMIDGVSRHSGRFLMICIKLRNLFLKYDQTEKQNEKDIILQEIQQYCSWNHNQSKPGNLKKIQRNIPGESSLVQNNDNEDDPEEDERIKQLQDCFQYDNFFNQKIMTEDLIINGNGQKIHQRYLPKLDYHKFGNHKSKERNEYEFSEFLSSMEYIDFKNQSFDKALGKTIKLFGNNYYSISHVIEKYGITDLIKLMGNHSIFNEISFHQEVVQRKFFTEFKEFQSYQFKKKLEVILNIESFVYKNLTSMASKTFDIVKGNDMEKTIRFFTLCLNYQENIFDENLFLKYCNAPHTQHYTFENQKMFSYSEWNGLMSSLEPQLCDQNYIQKVINFNIEKMYEKGVNLLKKFKKIFPEDYIKRQLAQLNFLHNVPEQDNKNTLYQQYIQGLQEQTYIELCHYNQKLFKLQEQIQLSLNIKNVQKLQVKVFEINTDNYYRKNMMPFATDINLDGLIAKYETTYEFDQHPSNFKHTEIFSFPQFNSIRGLFVFEFIGNGLSSRAVIQKGNISLIHKSTMAGHFAYILDEHRNICKGSNTGLFFDNNFFSADEKSGRIIIPFSRQQQSGKAIMIHEGFAQLTEFQRETERYQFFASILFHDESIIMGNLSKILIKPYLTLNEREKADLKLLDNNTKVTLQTINNIDNISVSKVYENVIFNDQEEYEIEFQVPSNISSIKIAVDASIQVVSIGNKQMFHQEQTFTVENHSSDYSICEQYLRNINGQYQYILKGKNGEPLSKVPVTFTFNHLYYCTSQSAELKTNKDGVIILGKLKNITSVTASCNAHSHRVFKQNMLRTWILPKANLIQYPTGGIIISEDEQIKLPFQHKNVTSTNVSLLQIQDGTYIENRFDKIKFLKNEKNKFGINYIIISNLPDGNYQLTLKKEDVKIQIQVHAGWVWNISSDFILKQRMMVSRQQIRTDTLRIDNISMEDKQIDDSDGTKKTIQQITVDIGGEFYSEKTRAHVWAFKFFPNDIQNQISQILQSSQNLSSITKQFEFAEWKNFYLSNRQLSDENRYILERRFQKRNVGNFLEKPTVLLKRNYIQDTTFTEETLNKGGEYSKQIADIARSKDVKGDEAVGGKKKKKMQQNKSSILDVQASKNILGFQNFLAHSAHQITNIKTKKNDKTGQSQALFELDTSLYSTIFIVVVSEDQSTHRVQNLNNINIVQRNLSLTNPYDSQKSFSELRRSAKCLKYELFLIEDITSTEMQIIDSLQKVWKIQKELKNFSSTDQEMIETLIKWQSYTQDEKCKKYSNFCCHEFNMFLKMKDLQFFDSIIKPFLLNKMEKTFIDLWLLDKDQELQTFVSIERVQELNTFEQCMLIQYLIRTNQKERALQIANGIKDRDRPLPIDLMNKIYDTVLNMNSLNSKKSEIEGKLILQFINADNLDLISQRNNELNQQNQINFPEDEKQKKYRGLFQDFDGIDDDDDDDDDDGKQRIMYNKVMRLEDTEQLKQKEQCQSSSKEQEKKEIFKSSLSEITQIKKSQQQTFKEIDNTKEYGETQYYGIKYRNQFQSLIKDNSYWVDLSQHIIQNNGNGSLSQFFSSNFVIANSNINEIAMVLALIDLPFQEESHGFRASQGRKVEIKAACNMIVFLKEIQEAETKLNKDLLVVHRYFEQDKNDKEVQEFLTNEVYSCQIIITNISNKELSFQALTQIPEGSLPLNKSHYQKSHNFTLRAFTTIQFRFYFYFPKTGQFLHFPTNISLDRVVVAKAQPNIIKVKRVQSKVDFEDFDDILASGSIPDILKYMQDKNLQEGNFNMNNIYWLCKERQFFNQGIQILKSKNIFDQLFWSFSIYHKDKQLMNEFFNSFATLKTQLGPSFQSSLVQVNQEDEYHNLFNFLDYYPLVNARTHRIGGMDDKSSNSSDETKRWILNNQLRQTYQKFMIHLISKKVISSHDMLELVNYLLMQERVEEAIHQFSIIPNNFEAKNGKAQIQYDYIKAYFDFFICGQSGSFEFKQAREVLNTYQNYPVHHWNNLFKEMSEQLKEIDQQIQKVNIVGQDIIKQNQINLEEKIDNFENNEIERKRKQVKMEPQMDYTIENKTINIDYLNIDLVIIKYYIIDLELLFSKSPFLNSDTQDFSFVQPYATEEITLDINQTNISHQIIKDLQAQNLVIEVQNIQNGIKKLKTYFSATMKVRLFENYGELKVYIPDEKTNQDKPLPKSYVKVYSKQKGSGQIKFFKDGYSDLRGRFEYAILSGTSISDIEMFSIFVQNETFGSLTKEAKPPSGLNKKL